MRRVRRHASLPPSFLAALALLGVVVAASVRCSHFNAEQPALRYVAFGDSFAAWETLHGWGYTKSFKDGLASSRKRTVIETNLAHAGDDSADMLATLRQPAAREALRTADVVSWNIGVNDFISARQRFQKGTCGGADNEDCLHSAVASFREHWDAILETLRSTPHRRDAIFLTMTLFYPGGAADDPSFPVTNAYLDEINQHIRSSDAFARVADVRPLFNGPDGTADPRTPHASAPGGLLLDDGHPNVAGAEAIATALGALGVGVPKNARR